MMILRTKATKANGLIGSGWWYVASEYNDNGRLMFTISLNQERALHFHTDAECDAFNQRHMALGNIDSPFLVQTI